MAKVKQDISAMRTEKKQRKDKILKDFLLQFTYTIVLTIILTVVYNAMIVGFNNVPFIAVINTLWGMAYTMLAGTVVMFGLYFYTKKKLFMTIGFYVLAAFLFFAWLTIFQRAMVEVARAVPSLDIFANTYRLMQAMFILLGAAVVAEAAAYYLRFRRI